MLKSSFITLFFFTARLATLHHELERASDREGKVIEDNRQLNERVSTLEKECASLTLELKAAHNRYNQEVRAHEETERSRLLTKEEANIEVVKGRPILYIYISKSIATGTLKAVLEMTVCRLF